MHKLALAPEQDGYTVLAPEESVSVLLQGGAPRMRKDLLGSPHKVTCTWKCDPEEYLYMQTFYRVIDKGVKPFRMDLWIESYAPEEYECRLQEGTWKVNSFNGLATVITATLYAQPKVPDAQLDEGIVTSFEAFGLQSADAYALLAVLVNQNMPDSIGVD